mgnify:CR=1 FL=1
MSVWSRAALWILDHPIPIWTAIIVITLVCGYLMTGLETDHAAWVPIEEALGLDLLSAARHALTMGRT